MESCENSKSRFEINRDIPSETERNQSNFSASGMALNDLKYAFRQLLKNPGFTAVSVLTLGLGIGANTSIFTVINTMLLRSLPVKNPGELVQLFVSSDSH